MARGNAALAWQALLLRRLEQARRYPPLAQLRHQQGIVRLHFIIDRHGNVLSADIAISSGIDVLDEETLSLIRRAAPLPPPPPDLPGDAIELVVPVEFVLR